MRFLDMHAKVMNSLPVTLLSFTTASSPIDHYSATILLPNSPTISPSSSSHTCSQFVPLPINLLMVFDCPLVWTDCSPSSMNIFSSFPQYTPSTFAACALSIRTDSFSVPFLQFEPFSFPSFLPELANLIILYSQGLSFLATHTSPRRIRFLTCR